MASTFTVSYDQDSGDYLVHQVSNAYSFAMIPAKHSCFFETKTMAHEQVRRLHAYQAKGNEIELRSIETPGRFEKVADTKYGCAWGRY